ARFLREDAMSAVGTSAGANCQPRVDMDKLSLAGRTAKRMAANRANVSKTPNADGTEERDECDHAVRCEPMWRWMATLWNEEDKKKPKPNENTGGSEIARPAHRSTEAPNVTHELGATSKRRRFGIGW